MKAFHVIQDTEPGIVDEVRYIGEGKDGELQQVGIKLRVNRNPVIGDKFAARHGQKVGQLQLQTKFVFHFLPNRVS